MAVQAQFNGLAGCLPCGGVAEEQVLAFKDYGALLSAAAAPAGGNVCQYDCAAGVVSGAQSELTCNGGGGEAVLPPSRKRGREVEPERYVSSPAAAALLPIPGMHRVAGGVQHSPASVGAFNGSRMVESAMASTSGRPPAAAVADAVVAELCRQEAEIDALVRAECERLRAGLEQARKRQCQALVRTAARALREKEAELDAARRRAADLDERLRQAVAESQAWCGLARSNEAVAAGLRATLDHHLLLLRGATAAAPAEEGFGESDDPAAADDAQSRCFVANDVTDDDATASSPPAGKWACKGCGEREASVLLLPCRHLCLCKACEPRAEACPVCLAAKNASIHVAAD